MAVFAWQVSQLKIMVRLVRLVLRLGLKNVMMVAMATCTAASPTSGTISFILTLRTDSDDAGGRAGCVSEQEIYRDVQINVCEPKLIYAHAIK